MSTIANKGIHFHLDSVQDLVGFAAENAKGGETVPVLTRASITSDQPDFYTYIEHISNIFFSRVGISPSAVYQLLILIHEKLNADIYINDFPIAVELVAKRDIEKGEKITNEDIADIRRLKFLNIEIVETDKVIFCFKADWKFGLFFDLDRAKRLDIDKMLLTLGSLYRYLSFQYVYKFLESQAQFEEMMKDGWFPFIEIISNEYKLISQAYANKFNFDNKIEKIIANFDRARIEKITNKWWKNQIFKSKRGILQAGIKAFLQDDKGGYINCINTLLPQVEGIIRLQYFSETGKSKKVGISELLKYLIEKGKIKSGSDYSLFLPIPFFKF